MGFGLVKGFEFGCRVGFSFSVEVMWCKGESLDGV